MTTGTQVIYGYVHMSNNVHTESLRCVYTITGFYHINPHLKTKHDVS
jgi:hypothetical protein